MKTKWKRTLSGTALCLFIALFMLAMLMPFVWLILGSFKTLRELFTTPVQILPGRWSLDNYRAVFAAQPFGGYVFNSVVIALLTTLLVMVIACMASYSLARVQIKGKRIVLLALLSITLLPPVTLLNPIYLQLSAWGMLNTYRGLSLALTVIELPMAVWFLNSYFQAVPIELEESATIDGCSVPQLFVRILLPLIAPGIFTVCILVFINAWNNFLFAQVFNPMPKARTVTVALTLLRVDEYSTPWGLISAGAVIVTAPLILAVLLLQRRIISGMMDGSVKA